MLSGASAPGHVSSRSWGWDGEGGALDRLEVRRRVGDGGVVGVWIGATTGLRSRRTVLACSCDSVQCFDAVRSCSSILSRSFDEVVVQFSSY
jgi:hypothetical protein